MQYTTLRFDVRDNVARITLNRPEAANSINLDLAKELMHAVINCSENPTIRALVITGAGRGFCTGGDLKDLAAAEKNLSAHLKELTTYFHAAVSRLTRMDWPVIAAVHGAAAGAGMSLAMACDIVVASESARFTMAYTRVGLTPDGASTHLLSRMVGLRRALELTMTNRVLSAQEALEWHIVTLVVPDPEVVTQAEALAVQLAAGPTRALAETKRLLYGGWTQTLETQMENETQTIAKIARTADAHEGIAAFLEKRAARFKGE